MSIRSRLLTGRSGVCVERRVVDRPPRAGASVVGAASAGPSDEGVGAAGRVPGTVEGAGAIAAADCPSGLDGTETDSRCTALTVPTEPSTSTDPASARRAGECCILGSPVHRIALLRSVYRLGPPRRYPFGGTDHHQIGWR
jgi:hypothetical protein